MPSRTVVITLFEAGHYETGAAALCNSLARNGFSGEFWCGVRGSAEPWRQRTQASLDGIEIKLIGVDYAHHLTNYKPQIMLDVAKRTPQAQTLVYLDPDIVLKCDWSNIEQWSSEWIAVVGDANWLLPASSPVRMGWRQLREQLGIERLACETNGSLEMFCNAGFVGIPRQHLAFAEVWKSLVDAVMSRGLASHPALVGRGGFDGFPDQELFNLALMSFVDRVSLLGPAAMDFQPGGYVFSHATGAPKPWQNHFIRSAFKGRPPSKVDYEFLRYADAPIAVLSESVLRRRKAAYKAARLIGMIYRRADY